MIVFQNKCLQHRAISTSQHKPHKITYISIHNKLFPLQFYPITAYFLTPPIKFPQNQHQHSPKPPIAKTNTAKNSAPTNTNPTQNSGQHSPKLRPNQPITTTIFTGTIFRTHAYLRSSSVLLTTLPNQHQPHPKLRTTQPKTPPQSAHNHHHIHGYDFSYPRIFAEFCAITP